MVGGSNAALPRAGVRQGDVHFVALTSKIYCRRGNQRWMCLFPLAPPFAHSLEIPVNPLGNAETYMCFANRALLSVVPNAPRLQGRAASVSQAGPSPGTAVLGAWEQEGHLCPPSWARKDLSRVQVHPTAQKEHFHVPGGKPCLEDALCSHQYPFSASLNKVPSFAFEVTK